MQYILKIEEANALKNYLVNLKNNNILTNKDLENLQLYGDDLNTIDVGELLDRIISAYKKMGSLAVNSNSDLELRETLCKMLFQKGSILLDIILNLKIEKKEKTR